MGRDDLHPRYPDRHMILDVRATLAIANRLLDLKEGRVAEVGTHAELLLNPDGEFRKLVDMQNEINQPTTQAVGG